MNEQTRATGQPAFTPLPAVDFRTDMINFHTAAVDLVSWSDIPVADAVNRLRRISVCQRGDRVVVVSPPADAALMSPNDAKTLTDLIH
jgi:hypothetical protein